MSTKITYIHHSCFVWEGPRTMVVFDYWCDTEDRRLERLLGATQKQIYFVVSHFHQDHFNPIIFDWGRATADPPRLLISHDVSKRRRVPKSVPVTVLRPGDHYEDSLLTLDAYRSTDVGIGSVVALKDADGDLVPEKAFHAGDLNNWYFPEGDERLHVLVHEMEGIFLSTVRDIQRDHPHITHAMFPLDPRLDKEWLRGPSQWLARIETAHFYPMHTWGHHDEVRRGMAELAYLFPHTQFHYNADPQSCKLYGTFQQIVEDSRQGGKEQSDENETAMIAPGITGRYEMVVTDELTAAHVGSGLAPVFATPMLVALMEQACAESVAPLLADGQSTVGTHIDIAHSAATPVGMKVWCESCLTEVDRRRLTFSVKAYDEAGLIGEGTHERFVIDNAKFMDKVNSKIHAQ